MRFLTQCTLMWQIRERKGCRCDQAASFVSSRVLGSISGLRDIHQSVRFDFPLSCSANYFKSYKLNNYLALIAFLTNN